MSDISSVRCYIEEYDTATGSKGARLRQKGTGFMVNLGATTVVEKQHLLRFLSAGRAARATMPGLYEQTGDEDCVLVSGRLAPSAPATITFLYDEMLSYSFA